MYTQLNTSSTDYALNLDVTRAVNINNEQKQKNIDARRIITSRLHEV